MTSNRSPDVSYNGSGYVDKTARDAIYRADRDLLKVRRLQLMNRLHSMANEHGFNASFLAVRNAYKKKMEGKRNG